MAIFVSDTFTDDDTTALASHTGATGATWAEHGSYTAGATTVHTNRVYGATVETLHYASGSPSGAEYDVEGPATRISSSSNRPIGLAARIDTGANTFYYASIYEVDTLKIFKRVTGTATELASDTAFPIAAATYALKFEIRNATKKLYVDSVEKLSSTDDAITAAGKIGVFAYGTASTTTTGFHLDSITATDFIVADRFDFGTEPANTKANATMAAVTVRAEDAGGTLDASYTGNVTVALTTAGGATLGGTLTQAAVAGVATFNDLTVNLFGTYTLTATGSLTTTASASFNITADRYDFGQEPSNAIEGVAIAPSVTVRAEDGAGTLDTGYTGNVTVAIGTNPGSGTLSGTLTQAAVAGVATFNNLSINNVGTGYTLDATGDLTTTGSATFNITLEAATHLTVGQQPTGTQAGSTITPAVTVLARNSEDVTDTNYTSNVVVALQTGTGVLSGTLTQAAVAGVATFNNLSVNLAGDKTLRATSGALTLIDSSAFTITSNSAVEITWTDTSTIEDGFKLERDDDGGGYVQIATPAADATSYTDDVPTGHTYTYRIRSNNANGNSEYSNTDAVVVP